VIVHHLLIVDDAHASLPAVQELVGLQEDVDMQDNVITSVLALA